MSEGPAWPDLIGASLLPDGSLTAPDAPLDNSNFTTADQVSPHRNGCRLYSLHRPADDRSTRVTQLTSPEAGHLVTAPGFYKI